jgi:hypothetical protein
VRATRASLAWRWRLHRLLKRAQVGTYLFPELSQLVISVFSGVVSLLPPLTPQQPYVQLCVSSAHC